MHLTKQGATDVGLYKYNNELVPEMRSI